MSINKVSLKDIPRLNNELEAHKMLSTPGLDIVHLCLKPGEQIPLHVNPLQVIFCIVKGKGVLHLEGSATKLSLYDVAEVPAGVMRGLKNPYAQELRVLVLKKTSE